MHSCSYIKRRIRSSSHSRERGNPDPKAEEAGPEGGGGGGGRGGGCVVLLGLIRKDQDEDDLAFDLEGLSPSAPALAGETDDGMPMPV